MSNATPPQPPRKRGPKPQPENSRRKPSARAATASRDVKDPVHKSDLYTANLITPQSLAAERKARANRLRELIEPKTEAMVHVMIDIAEDKSVHPSIRMECADRVLSRAYGKPKEHVEVSDTSDAANSSDEVMKLLGNIFEAVGLPPLLPVPDAPAD